MMLISPRKVSIARGAHLNKTRKKLNKRRWLLFAVFCLAAAVIWVLLTGREIARYSHAMASNHADAAIVLGAAVWKDSPSPVFRERINHALDLYKVKRVRKIIFTGGLAQGDTLSEAESARNYAIARGIPTSDLVIENRSRTTYDNLANAKYVADRNDLHTFVIVSDPLHMRRAMDMSNDLGMNSAPSPTPTSMFRGAAEKQHFLWREVRYLLQYRLWDRFVLSRGHRR
jgi:uncharacterized SAM-binding protein YcdF (DUF218 family)